MLLCLVVLGCCRSLPTPMVSIVIPIYNMQSWISICMISILNQTYQNIEVICIDDGSKDKTLQILNYFAEHDERVKVIHQENCGQACALNAGLLVCMGEYVTFVDPDDWIDFDLYEIAVRKAVEFDLDVVSWGCVFVNEGDRVLNSCSEDKIFRGDDAGRFLFPTTPGPLSVWSRMYKHSMIRDNGIVFDFVKRGNDLLFNFDLVGVVDSVFCMSRGFYHYNVMPTGMFNNYTPEDNHELAKALIKHLNKLKNTSIHKNRISSKESEDVLSMAKYFMDTKSDGKSKASNTLLILLSIVTISATSIVFISKSLKKKKE